MLDSHFQVWSTHEPSQLQQWEAIWQSWPDREVYAHPNYVNLYAAPPKSFALCAAWQSDHGCVLYPFIFRDLTIEPFWSSRFPNAVDITTPYGYGGPFAWGGDDKRTLAAEFWEQFDLWASQQNVICEFIRFSVLPNTLEYPGEKEVKLQNIVRNLDLDEDTLWMDFEHKVRKNVKKAQRSGVHIEYDATGERFDEFLRIYRDTMQRRSADSGYYFSRTFFEQIREKLAGQFMYFHAWHDGRIISTELILISANSVYSFLGGTVYDMFELRPNDLIKFEIINWAKSQRKHYFVLGGGYGIDDGIFRYKRSFAPGGCVPFFIGRRVFHQDLYDQLVERREAEAGAQNSKWFPAPGFFPLYRA